MLATSPCGASSNIALWRAKIIPPVERVVGDLEGNGEGKYGNTQSAGVISEHPGY